MIKKLEAETKSTIKKINIENEYLLKTDRNPIIAVAKNEDRETFGTFILKTDDNPFLTSARFGSLVQMIVDILLGQEEEQKNCITKERLNNAIGEYSVSEFKAGFIDTSIKTRDTIKIAKDKLEELEYLIERYTDKFLDIANEIEKEEGDNKNEGNK